MCLKVMGQLCRTLLATPVTSIWEEADAGGKGSELCQKKKIRVADNLRGNDKT